MSLTQSQKDELLSLIRSGQKIVAIKRYRELTGVGLQEALYAVGKLAEAVGGPEASRQVVSLTATLRDVDPKKLKEAEAAAMAAIRDNNAIEAIKRYRQHTNLSLKDARDAVDALSLAHRSGGRINPKLAATLIAKIAAGQKDEALTLAMSNAGYDDTEARALIRDIVRMRPGAASCATGCLKMLVFLALLAAGMLFGLKQVGLV